MLHATAGSGSGGDDWSAGGEYGGTLGHRHAAAALLMANHVDEEGRGADGLPDCRVDGQGRGVELG